MTPRDRDGSELDPDVVNHDCRRGWIGEGLNVRPCPICKPHLFEHTPDTTDEPQATVEGIDAARTHLTDVLGWQWASEPNKCVDCGALVRRRKRCAECVAFMVDQVGGLHRDDDDQARPA